ncbi:MAG: hypothetical protein GY746_07430 [Gammaproteobacteria bacterium]|nr:hypothetical protein [Gammaproteobacteria bacterium]
MSVRELVMLVVIAVAGGGGAGFGYSKADDPRPDPYTGTQGRALSVEIDTIKLDMRKMQERAGLESQKMKDRINGLVLDIGRESRATSDVRQLQYRMNTVESALREHKADRDNRDHVRTMP